MVKYFITFLCFSLAIPVIAGGPRLSRSDIGHVTMIENPVLDASSMTDANSSPSMSQFMRERHLSMNDNRLNNRSPRRISLDELEGVRIASSDAYNFIWDSSNQIAIVDSTSYAMKGSYCKITYSETTGKLNLTCFYDIFSIPIEIDLLTNSVTIKAGTVLSSIKTIEPFEQPMLSNYSSNPQGVKVYWRLYAMPLSWLTGNDNYDDIHGYVAEDGTITFNDDFAFLVKSETFDGELRGWRLSPIFKNLNLLNPNGNHRFTYIRPYVDDGDDVFGPVGSGYGGLVPRKPGTSKPVSPRPFTSTIGANNLNSNSNRFSKIKLDTNLLNIQELHRVISPVYLPDGHGGLVPPRRPGNPNPSNPRLSGAISLNQAHDHDCRQAIISVAKTIDSDRWIPDTAFTPSIKVTNMNVPVYMIWADDTTLMVYNLFGLGNRCYINVKLDGTMCLPNQEIYNNGLGSVIYNNAKTGTWTQDSITWGYTRIYDDGGDYENHTFTNNVLSLADAEPYSVTPQPTFVQSITDTTVMFSATVPSPNDVFLYMYDSECDDYIEVNNPLVLTRLNEPYWVYLGAQAYNPNTYVYSDITWYEYEIPALDTPILRGDVNNDGAVNISDVTAMIDGLLTGNWDGKNYDNADCNLNGEVSISDVTSLIDYLLSGTWAE